MLTGKCSQQAQWDSGRRSRDSLLGIVSAMPIASKSFPRLRKQLGDRLVESLGVYSTTSVILSGISPFIWGVSLWKALFVVSQKSFATALMGDLVLNEHCKYQIIQFARYPRWAC